MNVSYTEIEIARLHKAFKPRALSLMAKRFGIVSEDAEDVYHIVWGVIWERLKDEKPVPDLRDKRNYPWFFSLVFRRSCNHLRGVKRLDARIEEWAQEQEMIVVQDSSEEDKLVQAFHFEMVMVMLEKMPPRCQALLKGFYLYGMSIKKLSEEQGLKEQSVKNGLHDCRKDLRNRLGIENQNGKKDNSKSEE